MVKLLGFTDTRREATSRVKGLKSRGFKKITIKKEFDGFAVRGIAGKVPKKTIKIVKRSPIRRRPRGIFG